jgi:hypothetical protein
MTECEQTTPTTVVTSQHTFKKWSGTVCNVTNLLDPQNKASVLAYQELLHVPRFLDHSKDRNNKR